MCVGVCGGRSRCGLKILVVLVGNETTEVTTGWGLG